MSGLSDSKRSLHQRPVGVVVMVVFALLTAAITCGDIQRRTEAVDPMYHEDEIDVMVDYGATLQAQEATATARASGLPKPPPSGAGEDVPILPPAEQPPAAEPEEAPPPAEAAPPAEVVNFGGSWHSTAACDEQDAPYHWEVKLRQDPTTDAVTGTISFHACPGGGRASYNVSGTATPDDVLFLEGQKTSGRGGLDSLAPASQTFRLTKFGEPFPNFAP